MDINAISQIIGSLGFPIVCCGALFWRMVKSDEKHAEEMSKVSDALNNNTNAINQMVMYLKEE